MKLKDSLKKGRFVVTSEVQTPIDEDPQELIKSLELIRGRVDGVTVSELDIEGVVGDTIKTCQLLKQNRFESIYQTTTREKNRPQLQKDLISAHEAGIENLLVFTEDYRITGRQPSGDDVFPCGYGKTQLGPGAPERRAHDRRKRTAFQGAIYPGIRDRVQVGTGMSLTWR